MTSVPSDGAGVRPLLVLLFHEAPPSLGEPLYRSATELGQFIVDTNPEYKGKSAKSVATFVHQIARGERTCPDKLRRAIEAAIKDKLSDEREAAEWLQRVNREFTTHADGEPRLTDVDELWSRLLEKSRTEKTQFIITARPAESQDAKVVGQARQLANLLLERLNLLKPEGEFALPEEVEYIFCFPDQVSALGFWKTLLNSVWFVARACSRAEAADRLKRLNDAKHLRVWRIPEIACGCPIVVYNPTSLKPDGYVLYYFTRSADDTNATVPRGEEVSIARMDRDYLGEWLRLVYNPITEGNLGTNVPFEPPT